jgi:hypothetical protein
LKTIFATNFYLINSISYCTHIANSMDSSESCMTHQHHLKLQWDQMCKQCANESFIEHESWLAKQNDYACKKYAKESITIWKQRFEQSKIYMRNQCDTEIKKWNV